MAKVITTDMIARTVAYLTRHYRIGPVVVVSAAQDACSDEWEVHFEADGKSCVTHVDTSQIVDIGSQCNDAGCQREFGHDGLHMSRRLGYGNDEIVDEWGETHGTVTADDAYYASVAVKYGIAKHVLNGGDRGAALAREIQRTPLRELSKLRDELPSPEQIAKDMIQAVAAQKQQRLFAVMQAMASVMGQVKRVAGTMNAEDAVYQHRVKASEVQGVFGDAIRSVQGMAEQMLESGWRDRAASRWTAQVRAKVKEREEAARMNVAIRVQTEED